jgi:hypothetical protein
MLFAPPQVHFETASLATTRDEVALPTNSRWRLLYSIGGDWPNLHLKARPPEDRDACFKQKTSN